MRNATSRLSRCCSLQDALAPPEQRKFRRVHGLQLPLHPQQVAGWIALLAIAAGTFTVVVPLLGPSLQPLVSCLFACALSLHAAAHLAALLLDPADPQVRAQPSSAVVPEFDRSRHLHVIENGRCHLCNISTTSRRTKHCSICNKCIARFDHHCKWLNNCIGGRNYYAFIVCLVTAIVSAVAVAAVSIAELCLINLDAGSSAQNLTMDNITLPMLPSPGTGSLIVISVVGILSAIAAVLLIHLCFFHGYIACLGLTTYEYVRRKREKDAANAVTENVTRNETPCPSFCKDDASQSARYHFCKSVSTKDAAEVDARSVYICSMHQRQSHGEENGSGKERRNFHLYFSYESRADETSIEVSSRTILDDPVQSQESIELKPSTPSPVSCCFSIINPSSAKVGDRHGKQRKRHNVDSESEKGTRSCAAVRRIQSFLRTRLRRNARQRSLNTDLGRARKNKVNPVVDLETAKEAKDAKEEGGTLDVQCISETPKEEGTAQLRPPVKLPPLTLPARHRMKQVALAADVAYSLATPAIAKRGQPPLRARRTSFYKRPRFKLGPHVTQSAQLSPIPESELSKPASPRSPPQHNHFTFPPCITGLEETGTVNQTGIT